MNQNDIIVISAEDARKLSLQVKPDEIILEKLSILIKAAAALGKTTITYKIASEVNHFPLISALESLGYRVGTVLTNDSLDRLIISWQV